MPHLMCVACRTRCQSAGPRGGLTDDRCPDCGAPWEQVGTLSCAVGFRLITPSDRAAAQSDEARWLDDGGGSDALAAIAVALPHPRI
jgi:hypothetical protein